MLKDLDTALKASTNYIESHRTEQLPNGTREFHEYRSSTTSGGPRTDDFNLERQVNRNIFTAQGISWHFLVFKEHKGDKKSSFRSVLSSQKSTEKYEGF